MRDLNSHYDGLIILLGSHHVDKRWRTSPLIMSAEPFGEGGRGYTGKMK